MWRFFAFSFAFFPRSSFTHVIHTHLSFSHNFTADTHHTIQHILTLHTQATTPSKKKKKRKKERKKKKKKKKIIKKKKKKKKQRTDSIKQRKRAWITWILTWKQRSFWRQKIIDRHFLWIQSDVLAANIDLLSKTKQVQRKRAYLSKMRFTNWKCK